MTMQKSPGLATGMGRDLCAGFAVLVMLVARGTMAHAQSGELRGSIRESLTGQPLAGAVVSLLDSTQAVVQRLRSGANGQFRVQAPDHVRSIRVQRLGFSPREIPLTRSADTIAALEISMDRVPALLQRVEVRANPRCPVRPDFRRAQSLLEQARAGVLSFVLARDLAPVSLVRATYTRRIETKNRRILSQEVQIDSSADPRVSFSSERSGADFVRLGFKTTPDGSELLGPDAEVLLDADFAAGYCFRVGASESSRANQVGLAFSPAQRERDRIDINGTLWIDTVANRLIDLEYRYVGLGEGDALHPGGRTVFHELSSGIVIVDRWSIQLPEPRRAVVLTRGRVDSSRYSSDIAIENGGDVLYAAWPDGAVWRPPHPSLRLRVNSRSGQPLAGLQVSFTNAGYRGVTDTKGDLVLSALIPGTYEISVQDPLLPQVDLAGRSRINLAGDTLSSSTITATTLAEFAVQRCRSDRRFVSADAPLIGYVATANGEPVDDAEVTYGEPSREPLYRLKLRNNDGIFALCLGRDQRVDSLELTARKGNLEGTFTTTHGDRLRVAGIRLGVSTGAVVGVVLRDSFPAEGVLVGTGTGNEVRTGTDGRFVLTGIRAGISQLVARGIGLAPVRMTVGVQPGDTTRVTLRMTRMTTLDSVVVTAEATARRRLVDQFIERRRSSVRGYFRDSSTIGNHNELAGVFGDMPTVTFRNPRGGGLQVMMRAPAGSTLSSNGNCAATIWLDRVKVLAGTASPLATMRPEDIAAIEVYPTLADTPFEFGGAPKPGCGAVVIWTKRAWP
jgi:hypothetical protein